MNLIFFIIFILIGEEIAKLQFLQFQPLKNTYFAEL